MQNVKPCPYCGGEVEIVKLIPMLKDKFDNVYRIECKRCRKLVARGIKFDIETEEEGRQRIEDYQKEINRIWSPASSRHFKQTLAAEQRDYEARFSSRIDPENELED